MFDIISIGRADILVQTLNGVAMLFSDAGPAGFGGLVSLGLLVGILIAVARAVITQRLEVHYVLVGWLIYAAMFYPKVTATVEDVYTGQVTEVANVPVGLAAVGGLTSTIGVTMADAFSTVFAVPSLTNEGYLNTLDLLHSFRSADYGDANDGTTGSNLQYVDMARSLKRYTMDCVFQDMNSNNSTVTWESLTNANDRLAAMEVNRPAWFTTVWLQEADGPDGVLLNCNQAHAALTAFVNDTFYPAWQDYLGEKLGIDPADVETRVENAADAMFGPTGVVDRGRYYMLNALIDKEVRLSELGYHAAVNNTAGVVMRTQAMEQRRTQWAAEQSMFVEMARPLMSYIEMFFYAISPFMAFLLVLGSLGIMLLGRYLILAVWIQLWMPMMAINQLYINISASETLTNLQTGGLSFLSMTGMENGWTETGSWLAVGGMLAGATPLLSLMIITGSYYAMTQFSQRLSGGDHIDEKIESPDIIKTAPIYASGAGVQQAAMYTEDQIHGRTTTGSGSVLPALNFSSSIGGQLTSARSARMDASQDYVHQLGAAAQSSVSNGTTSQIVDNLVAEQQGRTTSTDEVMRGTASKLLEDNGYASGHSSTQEAAVQLALAAGIGGKGKMSEIGLGNQIQGVLRNSNVFKEEEIEKLSAAITEEVTSSDRLTVQVGQSLGHNTTNGEVSALARALNISDNESFMDTRRAVISANRTVQETESQQHAMGRDLKHDAPLFGRQVAAGEGGKWLQELQSIGAGTIDHGKLQDDVGRWMHWGPNGTGKLFDSNEAAMAYGIANQILNSDDSGAKAKLNGFMAEHFGTSSESIKPADSNSDLFGLAPDPDQTITTLQEQSSHEIQGVGSPSQLREDTTSALNGRLEGRQEWFSLQSQGLQAVNDYFKAAAANDSEGMAAAQAQIQLLGQNAESAFTAGQVIGGFTTDGKQEVSDKLVAQQTEIKGKQAAALSERYRNFPDREGPLDAIMQTAAADKSGFEMFKIQMAGQQASEAYQSAYDKNLAEGGNVGTAFFAGLAAIPGGWSQGIDESLDTRYDQYFAQAKDRGMPDEISEYYATEALWSSQDLSVSLKQSFGYDEHYNQLEAKVRNMIGQEGLDALSRAASEAEGSGDTSYSRHEWNRVEVYYNDYQYNRKDSK